MSSVEIGQIVGLERSDRWGVRPRVVIRVGEHSVVVADFNGIYRVKPTSLNLSLPGFLETPLPPALIKEYGLDKINP